MQPYTSFSSLSAPCLTPCFIIIVAREAEREAHERTSQTSTVQKLIDAELYISQLEDLLTEEKRKRSAIEVPPSPLHFVYPIFHLHFAPSVQQAYLPLLVVNTNRSPAVGRSTCHEKKRTKSPA